jgi:hypothetical protein
MFKRREMIAESSNERMLLQLKGATMMEACADRTGLVQ